MQMSEYLYFGTGGSVYGSLNGLWSTQRRKDLCLSDGITVLTVQLIPGRTFRDHQTTRLGNWSCRVSEAVGRNKDRRRKAGLIVDAGQRSRSVLVYQYAWLDEFTTYQVEGSVVDYLAFDG